MQYFNGPKDRVSRIGKIIGDAFSVLIYLSILGLMLTIIRW
jgi:hypothetical protein